MLTAGLISLVIMTFIFKIVLFFCRARSVTRLTNYKMLGCALCFINQLDKTCVSRNVSYAYCAVNKKIVDEALGRLDDAVRERVQAQD